MTRIALLCAGVGALAVGSVQAAAAAPGLANPASVYCRSRGGRTEDRPTPGGVAGYCHLPDGTVVDEWVLYRRSRQDRGR